MLKINKILSKKIKLPLSLRGASPHVIARERSDRSNLNNSGFSLIELMVAIVILALAIFGIFHAYSVGFMGMADARDRTVATNYLRETIEDFKNMDFNKVKDEPITLIPGTKFHRGSIVLDLEKIGGVVTLKKVITQVRWMDRKGNIKTEEVSTILYNKPQTSEVSNAAKIVLYASPYYAIIPASKVVLTAEIKDENGNTRTDWAGVINFSIINEDDHTLVGYISLTDTQSVDVPTTNGTATIDFISFAVAPGSSVDGIEKIQASATLDVVDEVTDTVNIRVTTGAVGILLTPADGDDVLPINETSTINVTVVKADYQTPIAYSGTITFNVSNPDIGSLSTPTINFVSDDIDDPTTVNLMSTGTPGVVEITASAPDLDMGYTEITFTGDAESILISPTKKSIYPGEKTKMTVTVVDENIKPVSFGTTDISKFINITASPEGYGTFDISSLEFKGDETKTCFFTANSKEVIDGLFLPKVINLTASDSLVELIPGFGEINILSPLIAHHIFVRPPYPSIIELDIPESYSEITAIMKSEDGDIVYGNPITFKTSSGTFSSNGTDSTILMGGEVTAYLYPPEGLLESTKAIIQIYSDVLINNPNGPPGNPENPVIIEVLFHKESEPDHINLVANPAYIFVGGDTCIITATIMDGYNIPINCSGNITFSIIDGGDIGVLTGSNPAELVDTSQATIVLSSIDTVGDVEIKAVASITSPFPVELSSIITVSLKDITLILVDGSVDYWSVFTIITFNIEIDGPSLNLERMKIEWNKDISFLNEIGIKTPSSDASYDHSIPTGNASSPYNTEDIINQILLPGESTIRLTFNKNMNGVPVKISFFTDFGEYIVEF